MKKERQDAILSLIAREEIPTQELLRERVAAMGFEVTQATLSRDLDEINAMKTRLSNGSIAYTIGDRPLRESVGSGIGSKAEQQMSRVLSGLVTSVASAKNLVVIHTPSGAAQYLPDPAIVADAERIAAENGGSILVTTDPREAVADADCIFTDTWVSMGEEAEYAIRSKPFWDYQVNDELMALAKPDALFQHCLPAYRGKEVTASVIDGPQSVVWDEAENRLHAQKALLTWLIGQQRGDESLLA